MGGRERKAGKRGRKRRRGVKEKSQIREGKGWEVKRKKKNIITSKVKPPTKTNHLPRQTTDQVKPPTKINQSR